MVTQCTVVVTENTMQNKRNVMTTCTCIYLYHGKTDAECQYNTQSHVNLYTSLQYNFFQKVCIHKFKQTQERDR